MAPPAQLPVTTPETSPKPIRGPAKLKFWHTAIIDDMLIHPRCDVKTRAARLGYSASYLGSLMNSDMFKFAYEQRREEFTEKLDQSIILQLKGVADASLGVLKETIEKQRTNIPFADQVAGAEKVLGMLGFGPASRNSPPTVVVQNTVGANASAGVSAPVSAEALEKARSDLRVVEEMRRVSSPVPSGAVSSTPQISPALEPKVTGE